MNLKYITLYSLLVLLAVTACHPDDDRTAGNGDGQTPILFTAQQAALTRTTDGGLWGTDEHIQVVAYPTADKATLIYLDSYIYKGTGAGGSSIAFAPLNENNTAYYAKRGAATTVVAYGGAGSSQLSADGTLTFNSGLGSDFISTDAVTNATDISPITSLKFNHRMAKLTINVKKDENAPATIAETIKEWWIKYIPVRATYNLLTGWFVAEHGAVYSGNLTQPVSSFSQLIVPMPANTSLTIRVTDTNGEHYTATLSLPEGLKEGVNHEATFTMSAKATVALTGNTLTWEGEKEYQTGTEPTGDVLYIHNLEELKDFRDKVNNGTSTYNIAGKTIRLMADIDMSAETANPNWEPIGNNSNPFIADFDGMGHTITGMKSKLRDSHAGFFGNIENATVKNLILKDADIKGSISGTLAALCDKSTITLCAAINTKVVEIEYHAGGLIGDMRGSTISGCYATGTVDVSTDAQDIYLGGLIGYEERSTLKSCYAACKVNGSNHTVALSDGFSNHWNTTSINSCATSEKRIEGTVDNITAGFADKTQCLYNATPEQVRKAVTGKNYKYLHYWSNKNNNAGTGPALRFEK